MPPTILNCTLFLVRVSSCCILQKPSQDFEVSAKISDRLLAHYSQTWKDREVYWVARERAKCQRDILVLILDSYDHAKLSLPAWPLRRCPKRALFENTRRASLSNRFEFKIEQFVAHQKQIPGLHLTLTGVIVHGRGVYMFMSDEGMAGGSNWSIECAT